MGMSPNKIDRVVARLTISRIADIFHQEVQGIPFTSVGHYRMREAAEKLILDLILAYKRGQNSLGGDPSKWKHLKPMFLLFLINIPDGKVMQLGAI